MACRKAAYRAETELSEHIMKQQEEMAKTKEIFELEQKQKWTPHDLLDQCCMQWLAHGPEIPLYQGRIHRVLMGSRGCSGGCLKAHPRISLDFQCGLARAHISHALDPFVCFFEQWQHAAQTSPLHYTLQGTLPDHYETLKAQFGSHLVKVSSTALAASKRAQDRFLEQQELERQAKRRKIQGKAANSNLLESVLEVCYHHSFFHHLDIADIAWMRLTCKTMAKIAVRMASTRMKQIQLSYSGLANGTMVFQGDHDNLGEGTIMVNNQLEDYTVMASHLPLVMLPDENNQITTPFVPQHPGVLLEWESNSTAYQQSRACVIRVYLEGNHPPATTAAAPTPPEREVLFARALEIGRYRLHPTNLQQVGDPQQSGDLSYKVVSFQQQQQQEHSDDDNAASTTTTTTIQGSLVIQSLKFDFNDLLGIYVRKKLPLAKAKYLASEQKRLSEKQYVKALAKAAREAPGSAMAFQGMTGW